VGERTGGAADGRPTVTLFVHDLAANSIVRAGPLAEALAHEYQVEMVGLLLSGPDVYAPYRGRFPVRGLRCEPRLASIVAAAPRLARMAGGDVLYACKPLFSTLLPAVLASRRGARPLLLDVEDDERAPRAVEHPLGGLRGMLQRVEARHALRARAVHPLARLASAVTVATRGLQRQYGGTLIRHGPDPAVFEAGRVALPRSAARRRFGLPADGPVALFAGWPRPHKGWETLLRALELPQASGWHLALAGPDGSELREAAARLGSRFHALGVLENEQMPALLAATDAVPVPQRDEPYARNQLPAKALEAMAMGVPVVGTTVGDLPEILGGGERGWLVPPDDPSALAAALQAIAADPAEAARRGAAARGWFVEEGSVDAIRARISPLVAQALAGRR
jgi:glycosyltransferase involved in cell wall biosynthesis